MALSRICTVLTTAADAACRDDGNVGATTGSQHIHESFEDLVMHWLCSILQSSAGIMHSNIAKADSSGSICNSALFA